MIASNSFSQNCEKYYYYFSNNQIKRNKTLSIVDTCQALELSYKDNEFALGKAYDFEGDIPRGINAISIGKVTHKKDMIFCYDKRLDRKYKFKQLNPYTIEVLNHTAVFVKGTRLYLHVKNCKDGYFSAFYNINDIINSDYWKNGIRNGVFYWREDENQKIIYYKNNIALDSLITSISDKNSAIKIQNFIKLYGNVLNTPASAVRSVLSN